ncbi:host cell division inhibitor Icd-like protein [Escherichia albertii]|uniref:host cell division inhibitor Icd-like protein n=1 Tax=Enterobacteriaceae TaxID=543 RepID=UPI0013DDECAA|nr:MULTISPECIES: host cell division inhibitor Icd-like protein [Enterobacteriaceae]EFG1226659.1 host cell division inhibitor Icd-like protein [Escherichia albertii]MCZ8580167.1 host cell division inhibitor Icd-like protein [Escherichia albertii]MCZ8611379.1 host cell division inhibitor Icd-like protein [Escherichia albertii]MCZ8619788.1 host cell division inhibitor Icd-like protein [Escherichia albertii]MCZ8643294.1 host cell division inhibitor Icd-like protein [Escherichia albertii]
MTNTKKAAPIWSRLSEQLTRCALCVNKHKQGHDSRYQAGGQCYQSGSVRCHNCEALSFDEYSLRYFSRAKEHGANRSDSCSFFLRRLFRAGDVFSVDSSLVIVCACKAMRRSTSHHGADSFYPFGSMPRCCNSLRRTRLIQVAKDVSPSALAASSSCALKSSGNRIWYGGERFSNGVDMVITLHYYTYMVITIVLAITQKATPRSAGTHAGRLTNNVN